MLEISKIVNTFTRPEETQKFEPVEIDLEQPFPTIEKTTDDIPNSLNVNNKQVEPSEITPKFPSEKNIIAIDSTAFNLGVVEEGVVGSVRLSVIIRKANQKSHFMERYGSYIFMVTNQNKHKIYENLFKTAYGYDPPKNSAPDSFKMIDRVRNLLERYIQLEAIKSQKNSIILLDGSLIGNTIANPGSHISRMMDEAFKNNNTLVAISKFTNLILKSNGKNITSLCQSDLNPSYRGPLNGYIDGDSSRYLGDIYVARLTKDGEPFRIDLPYTSALSVQETFQYTSGLAGDYGYPEELKIAHSTCVHSSIEILELQAASINEFKMDIEENLRKKLFAPF